MLTYSLSQDENSAEELEDVVAFIVENRKEGIADATTKADLLRMGHEEAIVNQAFAQLQASTNQSNGKNGKSKKPWLWPAIGIGAIGLIGAVVLITRKG